MPLTGERKRAHNRKYGRDRRLRQMQTANKGEKKILISFRIEESVVGRVQRMVAEAIAHGRYRWKTPSATWRGLILHGFAHPELQGDDLQQEMRPYIDLLQKLDAQTHKRQEANAIVARAKNEIHELLAIKEQKAAATWYHTTMDALRQLPPDVWSEWAITTMETSFPELVAMTARGVRFAKRKGRGR